MSTAKREFFSPEDDMRLRDLVGANGTNAWSIVAGLMGNKTTRQCRERFKNYLNPALNRSKWTPEEDRLLVEKFALMGPLWSKMVPFFNNRADVDIKNHWSMLSARLKKRPNYVPMPMIRQTPTKLPGPMITLDKTQNEPETQVEPGEQGIIEFFEFEPRIFESPATNLTFLDFLSNIDPSSETGLTLGESIYEDFDIFG